MESCAERVQNLVDELLGASVFLGCGRPADDFSGHVVSEDTGDISAAVRPGVKGIRDDVAVGAQARPVALCGAGPVCSGGGASTYARLRVQIGWHAWARLRVRA
jgi:hypothetical protein